MGESAEASGESPDMAGGSPDIAALKGREGKGIEKNGREGKTPNPLQGVFPKNLISDKFKKARGEWIARRVEIKKSLKSTQVSKQLKRLSDLGEAGAVNQSYNPSEYSGIYCRLLQSPEESWHSYQLP